MKTVKKTWIAHFVFQFIFITFLSGLSPAFAEIYHWTDEEGVLHITDDLGKVPEEYRSKAKVFETGPAEEEPAVEPAPPPAAPGLEVEELYDGQPLDWWKEEFEKIEKRIAELEGAYNKKRQFVSVFEAGRRFGQVFEQSDVETYQRYKKEIPEDEKRFEELDGELEELRRKARSAGVPKEVRGE
jgi:hypothetical protein